MNSTNIQEQETVYFSGLTNSSDTSIPEWYAESRNIDPDTVNSFTNVINNKLPNAKQADLHIDNPLDENDSLDELNDWVAVIDPRRAKLAADGQDIKYTWHVPTNQYSIVTPIEAYSPLVATLRQHSLDTDVFGEVLLRDYGGEVYIRMIFESKKVTGLPGNKESPVYLGLETGYDFKGGRAIYSNMIGIDSYSSGIIRNITDKRSRRHVGNATDESHERDNDRTPIQDWWADLLERIDAMTDELTKAIQKASTQTISFTRGNELAKIPSVNVGSFDYVKPYTPTSFFKLHDMPEYLSQKAAARAASLGDGISELTLWELFRGLTEVLEEQDRCDEGATLNTYADVAIDLLWEPETVLEIADTQWNYEIEQEMEDTDEEQQTLITEEKDTDDSESFSLDANVQNEGLLSKREVVAQRQQSLQDFAQQL